MKPSSASNDFIISAFDREQWCPVLQARFQVDDLESLRTMLGEDASDDAEVRKQYILNEAEWSAVISQFDVAFDPTKLDAEAFDSRYAALSARMAWHGSRHRGFGLYHPLKSRRSSWRHTKLMPRLRCARSSTRMRTVPRLCASMSVSGGR